MTERLLLFIISCMERRKKISDEHKRLITSIVFLVTAFVVMTVYFYLIAGKVSADTQRVWLIVCLIVSTLLFCVAVFEAIMFAVQTVARIRREKRRNSRP